MARTETEALHRTAEESAGVRRISRSDGSRLKNCDLREQIATVYRGRICQNVELEPLIEHYPCELAYALALIDTTDHRSITPGWVLHNYPSVEFIIKKLRYTPCLAGCTYCNSQLDVHRSLKSLFGYNAFRTYEGEPLQGGRHRRPSRDAHCWQSSLPAVESRSPFNCRHSLAGLSVHGLTVISPLQSLMKDQVDNLAERGITEAVTINGMLDPITRALAIEKVQDGTAALLYISPEMLRSATIERILLARNVVRFVIDEAHCFSSWGQDFRVDYLYIGHFIRKYQQKKGSKLPIPVSCFTATAKQKVIQDIRDYFKQTLDLNLELFASKATRTNLSYSVLHVDNDEEKYQRLRELIADSQCPTIVYVSRTRRTRELASRLTHDGFRALPFNGKMDSDEKITNQEAFMNNHVHIIVATSAFGMGVDKSDVGLVIHYDISGFAGELRTGGGARRPQPPSACPLLRPLRRQRSGQALHPAEPDEAEHR